MGFYQETVRMMEDYPFEKLAAQFVSYISAILPAQFKPLVFSSTVSTRNSDVFLLWHDAYRKKYKLKILLKSAALFAASFVKGAAKILFRYEPFGYGIYGNIKDALLVVSAECGFAAKDGRYGTSYVATGEDDCLFVFGPVKECGKNAKTFKAILSLEKAHMAGAMFHAGLRAFLKTDGSLTDRALLFLEWSSWVLDLGWLANYYLKDALSETIEKHRIKKVGCIHEMHSYARVVWQVASMHGITGHTVQHASISHGKRWYFTYPEERESGLVLPDFFYVFNEKASELLRPYFTGTRFEHGCSCRFGRWIDAKPLEPNGKKYYLFVTSLAKFDNEVVIGAIRRLLKDKNVNVPVMLRLHSRADLDHGTRSWIMSAVKVGKLHLSKNVPLTTDIEGAITVIGMATMVLEEALLLGRPVVQLTHPDYFPYIDLDGIAGAKKVDWLSLSAELPHPLNVDVDSATMRNRLGLDRGLVTFERLFQGCKTDKT